MDRLWMANAKGMVVVSISAALLIAAANEAAAASPDLQTPASSPASAQAPASAPSSAPAPASAPAPPQAPGDLHQLERHILRSNASKEADHLQNAMTPAGTVSRRSLWLDVGLVTAAVALIGLWRRTWRRRVVMASVRAAAAADPPVMHDAAWRDACLEAGRGRFGDQAPAETSPPLTRGDKA
jgi:hypothetical protein